MDKVSSTPSDVGFDLQPIKFESPSPIGIFDLASEAARALARGEVEEFQHEGNNIFPILMPVTLATPPDLQVTSVAAPLRAQIGQDFSVTYTVTNLGGDIPPTQTEWDDLIYFSRDTNLDLTTDRFLGSVPHQGGLNAGEDYTVTRTLTAPVDLSGPYYVFVITDPVRNNLIGNVFESTAEFNNATASSLPVVLELPPPSDLQIVSVEIPAGAMPGETVNIRWTVENVSDEIASGSWSDSVFLSADTTWDIYDSAVGRVAFEGTLLPGQRYTSTLIGTVPSVTPGPYQVIVRADIFNQVYEDLGELNNNTFSPDQFQVTAEPLPLGIEVDTTLSTRQNRLFEVQVPADATLRVTVNGQPFSANEVYVRHGVAPNVAMILAAEITS